MKQDVAGQSIAMGLPRLALGLIQFVKLTIGGLPCLQILSIS